MTVEHTTVPEDGTLESVVEPHQSVCLIHEESLAVIEYTEANENGDVECPEHLAGTDIRVVGA